ncbi:MAG TPA: hypothetical protein VL330_27110 [Actinomycetes bacterium]|nr:hypothetical protein [Actinomycetes bacterium]
MSLTRKDPATGRAGTAPSWPAWTVLALSIGLWAATLGLGRAHGPLPGVPVFDAVDVVTYSAFLAWTVVGSVIISRRPSNRIGWLLSAAGLLVLLGACATHYALVALLGRSPGLPGGRAAAWLAPWTTVLGLSLWFWLLLLFPDGHLPSPRWGWVAWGYGLLALPGIGGLALLPGAAPGGFFELGPIPNPLGWEAAGEVLRPINATAQVIATALVGVAAASIVMRLRRASGVQRQQLKWLAYAAVLLAGFYLLSYLYTRGTVRSIPPLVDTAVSGLGLVVVPAAIGVAVLRYRLYDIDRLINRTLVYGLLTVLLGVGYAASVLVFGQLAGRVRSNLAVAAGTLTIAALFQPARRRVQQVVDRRFNRRRYDAATTIEAFSARLREQVDLDTLTGELLAVTDHTVEPTTSSLWLRPSAGRRL